MTILKVFTRPILKCLIYGLGLGGLCGLSFSASAANCGRTVTIDYQDVLIDNDATQKGEGLRYYLAKDPVALSLLDKYQEGTKVHWANAVLGTIGTGLLLGGYLSFNMDHRDGQKNMIISGVVLLAVNFLIAKTYESYNETYLEQAIEEYNRRHLPRIMLDAPTGDPKDGVGVGLKIERRF
jgi:hypothetical protein